MWSAILSAEDSRPMLAQQVGPLAGGLRYPDPEVRRLAVRGLGRLERDTMLAAMGRVSTVDLISFSLSDSSAEVRAEAANALGQAVSHSGPTLARDTLLAHLKTEPDPRVRGIIAQTLGRLSNQPQAGVEAALLAVSADTALAEVLGAARGIDNFVRIQGRKTPLSPELATRLQQLARYAPRGRVTGTRADSVARVRRLALDALIASRRLDAAGFTNAAADPDPQVRRLAILGAGAFDTLPERSRLIAAGLKDQSPMVRWEALRVYGQRLQSTTGCAPILQALNDKSTLVVLEAIDLLGNPCDAASKTEAGQRLVALTNQLAPAYGVSQAGQMNWHQSAHALIALSRSTPSTADSLLLKFAGHPTFWVRMYAARAAANLRQIAALTRLANDENDNVREAATAGLSTVSGHAADSVYVAQLSRKDYQLLITAANALDSTPNPAAALPALNAALQRVTGENRETSRDARMALLQRIASLGTAANASQLELFLYDFDPAIATEASHILTKWTGTQQDPAPRELAYGSLPGLPRVAELSRTRAVFHMRGGGVFEIALHPIDAPTNVDRFARLAASGYYDGLTFHRVVPNFVIQGGSPGANEYWGDGPFTRDEVTSDEHVRGTVGISTRGHDTGDGQIFVNLVDNPRLDHTYTIIGEVTTGMDVVDGILEGATIEKVELLSK